MTFEQIVMTVINEKLFNKKEISEDLHDKMQLHILSMDKNAFDSTCRNEYNKNMATLFSGQKEVH